MFRWIDDLPIRVKSFAGSAMLLICLIGLGTNALRTLTHWAFGLDQLSRTTLPEQRGLQQLLDHAGALQLNIFRYVAWANSGVSEARLAGLRSDISNGLDLVGNELEARARGSELGEQISRDWEMYSQAARDTIEIARLEAPMGTMMLGGVDDLYESMVGVLRKQSDAVGERARLSTGALTKEAEQGRILFTIVGAAGVLLSLVTTVLIARSITGPIQAVTAAMARVARGETGGRLENEGRRDEIGQMLTAIATFRHKIEIDNRALAIREQQVTTQNMRFTAALQNMSPGLAMFDRDSSLIVCNDRYAKLYGLSRELTEPGTTLAQILEHHYGAGACTDPIAVQYIESRIAEAGKPADTILELEDGRMIAVSDRPMSDGGWVSTHDDITERRRAEREREQAKAFLNTIIENVPVTIIVKDARDRRYVLVNKSGAEYIGRSREEIIGKTAYEVWSGADADRIHGHDEQLLRSDGYLFFDDHPITSAGNRSRIVTSRRIVIRGDRGEPQFLLGVIDDVTERRLSQQHIAFLAHHDSLTGLPNRASLRRRLEEALSQLGQGECLAVHYLDLDHFKDINDTLGHSVGDELLKEVANRLRACVRETDMIARLGGDEFAIVQAALEHPTDAAEVAQQIREAFRTPYELNGHHALVGVSIGIATAPSDGMASDELLKNADLALYRAKDEGRGTWRFFESEMDAHVKARRALELDLRRALGNGELELHYQPIINLERDVIAGCEALLRWRHPERGMIPPSEFIPVAEETGLITSLGEWVLKTACAEAAGWPEHIKVAVNVSPVQFKSQALALSVANALATSGLAARRLEIEITEAVLMHRSDSTLASLHHLRDLGVRIALDDFGTGYSSLSYLRSFPFDKIKIDRAFVQGLADRDASVSIVRAVIDLAESLHMTTTAEGVETQQQRDTLSSAGCTEAQGHLISEPRPAVDVVRLFAPVAARAGDRQNGARRQIGNRNRART
jgi:diguanylate cyclase (GGDEF)-like protein/PAS domain S-box-containing protein